MRTQLRPVYYISGFAADERVFSGIDLVRGARYLPWKKPVNGESIESYASRMAIDIREENAILVGLSFGGMIAVEIAKQKKLSKIALISSIKTKYEKPLYMKVAGCLKLNRVLPLKPYKFLDSFENARLGATTEEQKNLFREYRRNLDYEYSDWAIDRILNWENDRIPPNVTHIHAKDDKIFPIDSIAADHVIEDGGHMLIMNHADRVNSILKQELLRC